MILAEASPAFQVPYVLPIYIARQSILILSYLRDIVNDSTNTADRRAVTVPCLSSSPLTKYLILTEHNTNVMSSRESRSDFLSLPLEVRFRIYEDLLVCKLYVTPEYRPRARPPITLSVLRTCKQIYTEASPIFYSKNEILVDEPEPIIRWLTRIGRINVRHLRRLRIFVGAVNYGGDFSSRDSACVGHLWYKLLDELARDAAGLRHIYVYWSFKCSGAAGKDLPFVRRLGKLQRLQSMDLDGYYPKQWPSYLAKKLGIEVQEEQPSSLFLQKKYQRETENLIP